MKSSSAPTGEVRFLRRASWPSAQSITYASCSTNPAPISPVQLRQPISSVAPHPREGLVGAPLLVEIDRRARALVPRRRDGAALRRIAELGEPDRAAAAAREAIDLDAQIAPAAHQLVDGWRWGAAVDQREVPRQAGLVDQIVERGVGEVIPVGR